MRQRPDPRTQRAWQRIETEFDEPVHEVISGMRAQGATWRAVSGALEVSMTTLVFWRRLLGLPVDGTVQWDDLSREGLRERATGR